MKNMIRISVLAGLSMLSITSYSAMAGWDYKGHGGYRPEQGQGYAYYHQSLDHCKNTCDGDGSCKGVEYISNPQGWHEPGQGWVNQKCEIHRETFTHCDASFTGGKGAQDGCWVKTSGGSNTGGGTGNQGRPTFGQPAYTGTGCPSDNPSATTATISPDGQTLDFSFDDTYFTAKNFDRKTCKMTIPINVPSGIQLSSLGVDYTGFISGGSGELTSRYSFGGTPVIRTRNFMSWGGTMFDTSSNSSGDILNYLTVSKCGTSTNLQLDTAIRGLNFGSMMSLDRVHANNTMRFRIGNIQPCQ